MNKKRVLFFIFILFFGSKISSAQAIVTSINPGIIGLTPVVSECPLLECPMDVVCPDGIAVDASGCPTCDCGILPTRFLRPTVTNIPVPIATNTPIPTATVTITSTPPVVGRVTLTPTISITPTPACPRGDLGNLDCSVNGEINALDVSIFVTKWAPYGPVPVPGVGQTTADLNSDGFVDEIDLSKLLYNWGIVVVPSATSVPPTDVPLTDIPIGILPTSGGCGGCNIIGGACPDTCNPVY